MSKSAAKKSAKAAAKPEPKKKAPAVKPAPAETKPATPAPLLASEPSKEGSEEPVAAVQGRQHGIVEYVRSNGKTRRAVVVSTDAAGLSTLRLQDGTELTGIARAKSAADKDAWRPEGEHPYE